MTPTLIGRIQTRLFLVATFGVIWTLLVSPVLPRPDGASVGDVLGQTFRALVLVAVLGVLWELLYHALQQYRWEKDWPSLFALLTGVNEGILLWFVLSAGALGADMPGSTFVVHFVTTWIVLWLAAHGPMRILFLRWRYRGGRVL